MACKSIKNMLSEYLDNALDENNRELVATHLSSCDDCREALKTLEIISLRLKQLPARKAPGDFLDRLHQKMRPVPCWKRLYTALFVPFKIKIPLELATATAVAVLAFFVFTVQQEDTRLMESTPIINETPLAQKPVIQGSSPEMEAPDGRYDTSVIPHEKSKQDAGAPGKNMLLAKKSEPPKVSAAVREEQSVMAAKETDANERLFQKQIITGAAPPPPQTAPRQDALKPTQSAATAPEAIATALPTPLELALFMDLPRPAETFSDIQSTIAEESKSAFQDRSSLGTIKGEAKSATAKGVQGVDMVSKIKDVAAKFGGKLVYVEHDPSADTLISLQINIPSTAYQAFCDNLALFGALRTPLPKLGKNPPDPLSIKLHLYEGSGNF